MLLGSRAFFNVVNHVCGECGEARLESLFPPDSRIYSRNSALAPSANDEQTRIWREYKLGRSVPKFVSDDPAKPCLVERVEKEKPGVSAWLLTPLWWLMTSEAQSMEGVIRLIKRMPSNFVRALISEERNNVVTFRKISRFQLDEFALTGGPWGLGALACSICMLQIVGDSQLQRRAAATMLSVLLDWRDHPAVKPCFDSVWFEVKRAVETLEYSVPGGGTVRMPIMVTVEQITRELAEVRDQQHAITQLSKTEIDDVISNAIERVTTKNQGKEKMSESTLKPVPFERFDTLTIPPELLGENGTNRLDPSSCLIGARNDLAAVKLFLQMRTASSPNTYRSYSKEIARLLLWCWIKRKVPLSSLTADDVEAFRSFLRNPLPREEWIGVANSRLSDKWRPFQKALGEDPITYAFKVISALFSFLVSVHYLKQNIVLQSPRTKPPSSVPQPTARYFTVDAWKKLVECLEHLAIDTPWNYRRSARVRFLVYAFYYTGCKLSELASATMGQFRAQEVQGDIEWSLNIQGPNGKIRRIPAQPLLPELVRYRMALGLSPLPARSETNIPLISKTDDVTAPLGTSMIDKELRTLFLALAERIQEADPESASQLHRASAHWLRHSKAKHAIAEGVSPIDVLEDLGLSSFESARLFVRPEGVSKPRKTGGK